MTQHMRGFTLIETFIVIAVLILVSLLFMSIFLNFSTFFRAHEATIDVARAARELMGEIESGVLNAGGVVTSRAFSTGTFSTGTTTLVLELPAVNASGDVVTGAYDYVAIYASGTAAYRTREAHASSVRGSGTRTFLNLESLAFGYDSSSTPAISSVEADVLFSAEHGNRTVESHLEQKVYLRNKSP